MAINLKRLKSTAATMVVVTCILSIAPLQLAYLTFINAPSSTNDLGLFLISIFTFMIYVSPLCITNFFLFFLNFPTALKHRIINVNNKYYYTGFVSLIITSILAVIPFVLAAVIILRKVPIQ